MTSTVTRTKIIVPRRRSDLLSRKRLTDLLDDLLDYKLLLIAAPAGYGKTSLLVDWVHQNDLPVCWYALDPLDQDFQRFVSHFIASIAQVFPAFGKQSQAVLQSAMQSELDLNRIMTSIVNDAYEHIKEHFAIVLDDFHAVDSVDEINDFVNRFVEEIDENCHLVIASRTLLSLPNLPLMVGRSMVKGLSYDELAFKVDEIQALLKQNYHQTISAEVAAEIERETEGWITGLLLSAQTLWDGMTDRIRVARASGVGLYDYLAQQVLNQQPPLVRDFLLKTSLLEEFDVELCEAVLGDAPDGTDWFGLIGEVLQYNLFVLPVDNHGTWLRYHHLFRDFLQAQIAREHPAQVNRILHRLAVAYAERGVWEKSYEIYQRIGDQAGVIHLIEKAYTPMVKNGQLNVLSRWLDAFTLDELRDHPSLLALRGSIEILLGNVERGISKLNQAEIAFRNASEHQLLALLLVRRATGQRFLGNYQKSLSDVDEALSITDHIDGLNNIQAEAIRCKGLCHYRTGKLTEAFEYLDHALNIYQSQNDTSNEALLHLDLGLAYMSAGHSDKALSHYEHALDHWRQSGNIVRHANVLNNLGVLHHIRGDYEQAGIFLFEALSLARKSGNKRIEAFSVASLGDIYTDLDAFDTAREAYRQTREISDRIDNRFLLIYSYLAEATLSRVNGDLPQASDLLGMTEKIIQKSDSVYEKGLYQITSGQIALANGHAEAAVAVLGKALHCFDTGGQTAEVISTHISLGRAYFTLGDVQQSMYHLECAIQLATDSGNLHTLIVASREAKDILNAGALSPTITHQVTRLLKQVEKFEHRIPKFRRKLRQSGSVVFFEQPPKLNIRTMGITQVSLSGEPVTSSEWANQKTVRELFFLLLAHPDGLSKEAIGLIFWPDSSTRQLKMQFKNALYRLRRALGRDAVVFDENEDLYRFNWSMAYEYDAETFRSKISQGQNTSSQKHRVAAYRSAVKLYRGSYLPDVDALWVAIEREQLWKAYLHTELALAQYALVNRKYQAVLGHVHAILSQDPSQEEAHRLAMRAYDAIGNRADIVRQYGTCKDALNNELGVSPSPQTETLYKQLMRKSIS